MIWRERERDLLLLFPDEIPGDLPEKLVGEYVCVCEREGEREREAML